MQYTAKLLTRQAAARVKEKKRAVLSETTVAEYRDRYSLLKTMDWELLQFETTEKIPSLDELEDMIPEEEKEPTLTTLEGCFCPHYFAPFVGRIKEKVVNALKLVEGL